MPKCFDPRFEILPPAQREIWSSLSPAADLGFVLYGGTAIALQLGHRQSVDFDFFCFDPLDKGELRTALPFVADAEIEQDEPDTLVVVARMPSGPVRLSFFGGIGFGRVDEPLQSRDGVVLVAALNDVMATKLKATLDRAEAKDYVDLAAMLASGVLLSRALSTFRAMFRGEPATALVSIGYFEDGDLPSLPTRERTILLNARDAVRDLPTITLSPGSLAVERGPCS